MPPPTMSRMRLPLRVSGITARRLHLQITMLVDQPTILDRVARHRFEPVENGPFFWEHLLTKRAKISLLRAFYRFDLVAVRGSAALVVHEFLLDFPSQGKAERGVASTRHAYPLAHLAQDRAGG